MQTEGVGGRRGRIGDETVTECTKEREGTDKFLEMESSTSILPDAMQIRNKPLSWAVPLSYLKGEK